MCLPFIVHIAIPRPIGIQIPHTDGSISGGGGKASPVIVEFHIEDIVHVTMGEKLGGGGGLEEGWGCSRGWSGGGGHG